MRLLELRLLAYGPFTDLRLDLSAPGLHVIYGPNEAGKSTALRAIGGLFFGIEERTTDAYLHPYDKLRIGALLEHGGERLEVVRLKKRKRALVDAGEKPVDEAVLKRFLGGVTPALFTSMFGLDHQSLREGARALLRGEGDLGESLFDAGGARGVGGVLERLRQEADAIFKPRGQKQPLNLALASLKEARDAVKLRSVEPKAVTEQREALVAAEEKRRLLAERRTHLEAERQRASRLERVIPRLGRRRELALERRELEPVACLPESAREERLSAERIIERAERDAARLAGEIDERQRSIAVLVVDEALLALGSIAEIEDRLGRHRSAAADRPKREAECKIHEREVSDRLRVLGRSEAEASIPRPLQKRVEQLARQHDALVAQLAAAEQSLVERRRELAGLGPEEAPLETEPLEAALRLARRTADVDLRLDRLDAEIARLSFADTDMPAVLPSRADVARGLDELAAMAQAIERLAERRRDHDEERGRLEAELTALTAAGTVPSWESLRAARRRRDEALKAVGDEQGLARFREELAAADDLADQLARESERVTRHARLSAEIRRLDALSEASQRETGTLEERARLRREALERAWPAPPEAIVGYLEESERSSARRSEAERLRQERGLALEERARAIAALEAVLGEAGERLAPLIDRAEVRLDGLREESARRRQHQEARVRIEAVVRELEGECDVRRAALTAWKERWAEVMTELGLSSQASCDEALDLIETLRDLGERLQALRSSRRRLEGIDRDAEAFEALVRPIVERSLPEAKGSDIGDAAEALIAAARQAAIAAARRAQLEEEIAGRSAELATARLEAERARDALGMLMRAANVSDPSDLAAAEQRAERARQLEASLAEVEASLVTEGSLQELETLAAGRDLDEVRARGGAHDEELSRLEDELSDLDRDIGSIRHGLDRYDQREGAFGEALDLESRFAEIAQMAERWAKLRLAARILEREIRLYREKNQGPIIDRASALFPRLTLGEYQRLRVDFDASDEPRLLCIGVDGGEVGVDALSDGARDQLYLALRLASLERYAEQAELLPLIADDILVHFDEERARASLEVLADFTRLGQVLLFTHHARHVELARDAVGEALHVHELAGGHRRTRVAMR